jgi:hypothetical protein
MACLKAPNETDLRRRRYCGRLIVAGTLLAALISPAAAGEATADRFAFTGSYRFADIPGAMPNAMHLPAETVPIPLPNPGFGKNAPIIAVPQTIPETIATGKPAGDTGAGSIVTSAIPETRPPSSAGDAAGKPASNIATMGGQSEDRAPFGTESRSTLGATNPSDGRPDAPARSIAVPGSSTGGSPGTTDDDKYRTVALPEKGPRPTTSTRAPATSRRPPVSSKAPTQSRPKNDERGTKTGRTSPPVNNSPAPPRRQAAAPRPQTTIQNGPTLLAPTPPWAARAFSDD